MKINLKLPKRKKVYQKEEIHANLNFFWNLVVYSFFSIVLLAFAFGFYLYLEVNKESNPSTTSTSGGPEEKVRLDRALEYMAERARASDAIISSPSEIVDPSR